MRLSRRTPKRCLFIASLLAVVLLALLATAALALGDRAGGAPAKNVIIMINDGTGYNTWMAGDYWERGAYGKQPFEKFPVQLGVATFPLGGSYDPMVAWAGFGGLTGVNGVLGASSNKGVTESDMAATAMATGLKTGGGVGWAPPAVGGVAASQPNILEYAQAHGKATGVVTTKFFDDATPSGFTAHVDNRDRYYKIADQMVNVSKLDVIMGAGNPYFDGSGKPATPAFGSDPAAWAKDASGSYLYNPDGTHVINYNAAKTLQYLSEREWIALTGGYAPDADRDGLLDTGKTAWTFVQTRSDFQALEQGKTPARVFGLAQSGGKSLQEKRGGDKYADPYVVPFTENVPTIAEMTAGALNVLDNDPDGLVAMIEAGGAVDDACHDGYPGRVIEEYDQFNASMAVVLQWIEDHGGWNKNLLIVTSDHDTGYLWGQGSGDNVVASTPGDPRNWIPVLNNGKNAMPGFSFFASWDGDKNIWWHTNALVPLWAKGAGSFGFESIAASDDKTDPVRGPYIDNTDIFQVMYDAID